MNKEDAFRRLCRAFEDWYEETGQDVPALGILVIGLNDQGCDLQYIGGPPNVQIDWPTLFAGIIQEIERGTYRVDQAAEIPFTRQR